MKYENVGRAIDISSSIKSLEDVIESLNITVGDKEFIVTLKQGPIIIYPGQSFFFKREFTDFFNVLKDSAYTKIEELKKELDTL